MIKTASDLVSGDIIEVLEYEEKVRLVIDAFDPINDDEIMVFAFREDNGEDATFTCDPDHDVTVVY